jgi:Uma2 family endonuclease
MEKSQPRRAKKSLMNVAPQKSWTHERFFAWAQAQDVRHEFDGFQPVAMTGGSVAHSRLIRNVNFALQSRLRGRPCESLGPDAGIETINKTVRYPDALVTCSKVDAAAHLVTGVVVVFEVVSPTSSRTDRIIKVREYAAVDSIRRYVILESTSVGLTVLERKGADDPWTTTVLTNEDILVMPEIGIEIPLAEIYDDIDFSGQEAAST